MYEFCAAPRRPARPLREAHRRRTTSTRSRQLEALQQRGHRERRRAVSSWSTARSSRAREPRVDARLRLCSPDTGIVDAEELVKALLTTAEQAGRHLPARHDGSSAPTPSATASRFDTERETILARQVVNAAGLYADDVSRHARRRDVHDLPVPRRVRGAHAGEAVARQRARLSAAARVGHGLGVHLVRTTGGQVWLGPTVRYQDRKDDYESDRQPVEAFVEAGAPAARRRHARRPAPVGQRHPREAAPAERVLRRLHDPPRPREPGGRAGGRHRLARPDLVPRGRTAGERDRRGYG